MIKKEDKSQLLQQYLHEKDMGTRFRQQRAAQWMINEEVYMGQVSKTNLTRANYQIPHVFDTVHSVSAQLGAGASVSYSTDVDVDENAPEIMKSLFDDDAETYNLQGETDVSKVEAGIYGRAIYKMIPRRNGAHFIAVDTLSFYISPVSTKVAQTNFCGQEFIDKTLGQLEDDIEEMGYDREAVERLKVGATSNPVGAGNTQEESFRKLRMALLGMNTAEFDKEATISLTEHYTWFKGKQYVVTVANDSEILRCEELAKMGLRRPPFFSFATHPRHVTFWTTSPADIARDANLAMSTSMNQQIDNSTYKNFASMLVKSGSGLKQNSINPRPYGVTPVVVPGNEKIQDNVMMLTPPDIAEAAVVMNTIKQYSDSASGVGNPTIPKGSLTATQYAAVVAKAAQKNDPMRRDFLRCMREMADEYAYYVSRYLVEPRNVRITTGAPVTLSGVTAENFQYTDEFGETRTISFQAKALPEETEDENRAIKQQAAIQMYELFRNDPLMPGQKYLRERVLKEFEISPVEMDKLFSPEEGQNQMLAGAMPQAQGQNPPEGGGLPGLAQNPVASAAGIGGQAVSPI